MKNIHAKKITLRRSSLAFSAFMLIYLFDSISYGILETFNINLPVGFAGILITFTLIPFFVFSENHHVKSRVALAFLLLLPIIPAYLSGRGSFFDVYLWLRALSFFALGYYFLLFMSRLGYKSNIFFSSLLMFVGACFLLLYFENTSENYLRTSNGIMVYSFFMLSILKRRVSFLIVSAITIIVLYSLESRFSFFAFIFSASCLFFARHGLTKKIFIATLSIPFSFAIFTWLKSQYENVVNIHNHRFLRLIFESNHDTSLQGREKLFSKAIDIFNKHPIIGDYKYYIEQGLNGSYAHNAFSFWAEMGIIGIAISFVLLFLIAKSAFLSCKLIRQSPPYISFVFLSSIAALLGMLLAKSYVWLSLYFFSGLCYSFLTLPKNGSSTLDVEFPS